MHVRVSRVSRRGKIYEYAQLVESFRRPDGVPAHRVIANLGDATSLEVENLRTALGAALKHRRVVVARPTGPGKAAPQPVANLRYLDVAVLLELWKAWGLDDVLDAVMRPSDAMVSASSGVAALCIQRCVDPGSKLYATEWLPRTALPQLLSLPVESFNNTRVHRVLDELDAATLSLMPRLVERYQSRDGAFASLFIDVTDTWFVGEGPDLAERAKTKEGRIERKIGIVLLCNQQGDPLRWEVIHGRESEVTAMTRMLGLVGDLPWTQQVPLVCDRAMGRTAQLRQFLAAGLHFVTALTVTEYDAYTSQIPHHAVAEFELREGRTEDDIAEVGHLIEAAGLQRVDDQLFVMDLGVVERVNEDSVEQPALTSDDDALAKIMRLVRSVDEAVTSGRYASRASAGRACGLSKALLSRYGLLRRLPSAVQQRILDGEARGRSLDELIRITRFEDADQQSEAYAALIASPLARRASARPLGVAHSSAAPAPDAPAPKPIRVRAVLYFNPQLFVDQQRRARHRLETVHAFANELNSRLASPRSRMQRDQIAAAIDRQLRKDDLLEVFIPKITERQIAGAARFHVDLQLDRAQWSRRRRYDGFNIIVAHPELDRGALELCRLYRAKDVIEKDFQTIKSLVELRPIRHYTDGKVRAHVTVCMLALLLQRTLERKLVGLCSAKAALELLATAHLNRYAGSDGTVAHIVTRTDAAQNKILRALRLQHLADYLETVERRASA
jgi:Arc/MetJ-type ribon-helix-helix transcriptional regulator